MSEYIQAAQQSVGMAIAFIVFVLLLSMLGGSKMVNSFLALILLGTVLTNADLFTEWLDNYF